MSLSQTLGNSAAYQPSLVSNSRLPLLIANRLGLGVQCRYEVGRIVYLNRSGGLPSIADVFVKE